MRSTRNEHGIYLVFLAIFFVVAMILCAAVLAYGFIALNRAIYANALNSASLTIIERFMRGLPNEPAADRATQAILRANSLIMPQYKLFSITGRVDVGQLAIAPGGTGGSVIFGRWIVDPPVGGGPCLPTHTEYPCFEEIGNITDSRINAVKIIGQAANSFQTPLGQFLGGAAVSLTNKALAVIRPRCFVMVLDASQSTIAENHFPSDNQYVVGADLPCSAHTPTITPSIRYHCPRDAAYFAFDYAGSVGIQASDPFDDNPASSTLRDLCKGELGGLLPQTSLWCNLAFIDGAFRRPGSYTEPEPARTRFPTDYGLFDTVYGSMVVDKVHPAEPLTSFLIAMNAGLRMINSQSSSADRARFLVFKSVVLDTLPEVGMADNADERDYLIQLTNPDNIKQTPPIYPNFVSRGWFARPNDDDPATTGFVAGIGSNITAALTQALGILADPANCPDSAVKSVILFSDGIMNCDPGMSPECNRTWAHYSAAESDLLNDLMPQFTENEIVFTPLLTGSQVGPHYIDRKRNNKYVKPNEASAYGFSTLPVDLGGDPTKWIIDPRPNPPPPTGSDEEALLNAGKPVGSGPDIYRFHRPLGVFSELALRTGGTPCLLFSAPDPTEFNINYWDDDGDENPPCETPDCCPTCTPRYLREEPLGGGPPLRHDCGDSDGSSCQKLYKSPFFLNSGQQAAKCVMDTIGLNPFYLGEED